MNLYARRDIGQTTLLLKVRPDAFLFGVAEIPRRDVETIIFSRIFPNLLLGALALVLMEPLLEYSRDNLLLRIFYLILFLTGVAIFSSISPDIMALLTKDTSNPPTLMSKVISSLVFMDVAVIVLNFTVGLPLWKPLEEVLIVSLFSYFIYNMIFRDLVDMLRNYLRDKLKMRNESPIFQGIVNEYLVHHTEVNFEDIRHISCIHVKKRDDLDVFSGGSVVSKEHTYEPLSRGDIFGAPYTDSLPVVVTKEFEIRPLCPPDVLHLSYGTLDEETLYLFEKVFNKLPLSLNEQKLVTEFGDIFLAHWDFIDSLML